MRRKFIQTAHASQSNTLHPPPPSPLPTSSFPHPLGNELFHKKSTQGNAISVQQEEAGRRKAGVIVQRNGPPKCKKKIGQLIVPRGSKKNWGLSSLSLSPSEIPPRHLAWGGTGEVG